MSGVRWETPPRPLQERLAEYRDSLYSLADQMEALGEQTGKPQVVTDGVRLYRLVANDLSKLLEGDELGAFIVTGDLR